MLDFSDREIEPTAQQLAEGDFTGPLGGEGQPDGETDEEFSTAEEAAELIQQYWAAKEPEEVWKSCQAFAEEFHEALNRRGFYAVGRLLYSMFYGMTPQAGGEFDYTTNTVSFAGEDGEQVELNINELRSFTDQIVTMVTKTRPAFQAVATNTDYQTLSQVQSSDTVVQYFYANAYNEFKERSTVDKEVRYGKSYSVVQWDSDGGRMIEVPQTVDAPDVGALPAKPTKEKTGDIRIASKYFWDVVCDPYRSETEEHLWRFVREDDVDKWEAMARWPLYAQRISDSKNPGDQWESFKPGWDPSAKKSPDACARHTFYHAQTAALPAGRKITFINDVPVEAVDLPIDEIPVYPFISCEMDRTCFGVSDLWNIVPAEMMMNACLSDMATNIDAFGRPPLVMTEGTDIDLDSLANGQTVLFKPPGTDDPAPVKFPAVPDITARMVEIMRALKMSVSGSNAVARGDTSSNITSGAHAALYSQTAVENQNPRQLALDLHRERVANGILKLLKKFGKHPQLVAIAGVNERPYMDEFSSDQWEGIQRVTMKTVNPALRTVAGRLQIVEMLRDWPGQPLQDPQRIIDLISTGQMAPLFDPVRVVELAVRAENEFLLQGPPVQQIPGAPDPMTGMPGMPEMVIEQCRALVTDNVAKHIIAHLEVLYSPAAKKNPAIKEAVMTHIQEHMRVARMSDPMLASIIGNPDPMMGLTPEQPGNDGSGPSDKDVKGAVSATKPPGEDDSKGGGIPKPADAPAGVGL
jgi:hypothetical protein